MRLIPLVIGLLVVGGFLIYGCQEGPFGRKQLVTMSTEQEVELGRQAFNQVLQEEGRKGAVLSEGDPRSEVVRRIGLRLKASAEKPELLKLMKLRPMKFDWDFRVVQSKQVNAFCLPGGKVVVYTGILPVCETEAGLAAVMGHEIGHALARHGAERMAQHQVVQIGTLAAAASLGDMDPRAQQTVIALLGAGAQVGVLLPFSRSHESEADHIGILLMADAGYDPRWSIRLWQNMKKMAGGGAPPEFLSTHPGHDTRIKDLQGWLPQAETLYARSARQRDQRLPLSSSSPSFPFWP
jgi:predicted Zn-dependent protease